MPKAESGIPPGKGVARKKFESWMFPRKPQVVVKSVHKKDVSKTNPPKPPKPTPSISSTKKWVASPTVAVPTPDKETPWRHPAELEYITPDWSDDQIIDFLVKNGFSIPPRPRASKEPWTKVTSWDGQTVTTIPRMYRLPLMFAAKFQWQSLKLVMTSGNREKEWNEYKFDILHVSRLCAQFLEQARKAKAQMLMNTEWKCHMFDRAIIRYYQRWMLSREEFVKEFWYEFDEDEYRKNVFELNWGKFVVEGHKGFQLSKEEIVNGLTFEDLTEGCGFVGGRLKWGTSSNSPTSTAQDHPMDSSNLPPSNGASAESVGRLRPRVDALPLEVKREMLDDSLSISSDSPSPSSPLSPAPPSPVLSRNSRVSRQQQEEEADSSSSSDSESPPPRVRQPLNQPIRRASKSGSRSQSRARVEAQLKAVTPTVTTPSVLTPATNSTSSSTNTDVSSATSPVDRSGDGRSIPDKDVRMGSPPLPTPPQSAPSAPPILSSTVTISKPGDSGSPSTSQPPPKANTVPPKRPAPLVVQTTNHSTTESTAPSPLLGGSNKTPIKSSWDARVKATLERTRMATSKTTEPVLVSNTTPSSTPSTTPVIPPSALPPHLRRSTPVPVAAPPPASATETPAQAMDAELPPEYDEKELLKSYLRFPDSVAGTPAPPEVPPSNDLPPANTEPLGVPSDGSPGPLPPGASLPDPPGTEDAALRQSRANKRRRIKRQERRAAEKAAEEAAAGTVVQNTQDSSNEQSVTSPHPSSQDEKQTSPTSFSISSSRESSTCQQNVPLPSASRSPPVSLPSLPARIADTSPEDATPTSCPRSSSNSMDVDTPLTETVTTVLKHTLQGLTELMNTVHQQGHSQSSNPSNGVVSIASSSRTSLSDPKEPSLADLMSEIRSLKQAIKADAKQQADRDVEMKNLKSEITQLRGMIARSADDSMSVDGEGVGGRADFVPHAITTSGGFYTRSPSVMTPISSHPLSHLVHADEDDLDHLASGPQPLHHRSASGSSMGGGESASRARPWGALGSTHSISPTKSFTSPLPGNVPFKLKKKHLMFQRPGQE